MTANTDRQEPRDWVLVPREPTDAMVNMALALQGDDAFTAKAPALTSALRKIYKAMIAAAPTPPPCGGEARNPAFVGEWHARAVALGYDGVADMLTSVEQGEPPQHVARVMAEAALASTPAQAAVGAQPVAMCSLGVGCDETGVCYASAHGDPSQCGRAPAGQAVTDRVLRKVIKWAESRCPCDGEKPDPCTLCGATVAEGVCKAVNAIFPRALLRELTAALTPPAGEGDGNVR